MWTLLVSRQNDPPGTCYDRRQFDGGEIRIGRSAKSCDIVLPNDDGLISRTHCTISAVGLDLYVTDSSTNGVALNDPAQRIVPRQPVPIRINDRLIIHGFVITIVSAADGATAGMVQPSAPEPAWGAGTGPMDDVWGPPPVDPFLQSHDAGFGLATPQGGGHFGAGESAFGNDLVHDFLSGGNAFFDSAAPPPAPAPPPSDFGFNDGFGEAFSRPIMADAPPPPADFAIPENWDIDFGAPQAAPTAPEPVFAPPPEPAFAPPPAPAFDPFADTPAPAAFDPFASDPFADAPPPPPPIAAPPPPPPASGDANWAAFYEGAGLSPEDIPLGPDAMFKLGQMYRAVVLGMCDILQDRAAFKDEFRVERTQLSIGRNNPLKHLPAIEAAKVLLGPPLPGFMGMDDAVRTSLEDLKKHQLAMLAGVQNALLVVFDRLSPAEIERFAGKMEQKRGLLGRKAPDKWAVFITVFEALRRDATGNANGVMSVAFREGYEKFMNTVR